MKWKYILRGSLTKEICKQQNKYSIHLILNYCINQRFPRLPSHLLMPVGWPTLLSISSPNPAHWKLFFFFLEKTRTNDCAKLEGPESRRKRWGFNSREKQKGPLFIQRLSGPLPSPAPFQKHLSTVIQGCLLPWLRVTDAFWIWYMKSSSNWNSTRSRWLFLAPHAANTCFRKVSSLPCT